MYRIGQSTDIHQLVENRKLVLGGVNINHNKGALAHSEGDALLHAIAEAILGALALNDLGCLFDDKDPKNKDISSMIILEKTYQIMDEKGYQINNLDSLIIIEEVRMRPYIQQMKENISKVLNTNIENVNVKATCAEKLGFVGQGNGVVAQATVLLKKKD